MRLQISFIMVSICLAAGCSDEPAAAGPDASVEPACEHNLVEHGNDELYPGYVECSESRFPDFSHPTMRWDGSYPDGCAGVTGLDAYACMEQLFWQVFQFDYDQRLSAYEDLKVLLEQVAEDSSLTHEQKARMHFRLGQLAVAIIAENGDTAPGPQVAGYLETAHEMLPGDVIIHAWLLTVKINQLVLFEGDYEEALAELWALYEKDPPAVSGTVMAVAAGLPIDTGWPAIAEEIVDGVAEDDCSQWCGWDFLRAPYALAGQYYSYAEVYARVGNRDKAVYWLEKTADAPRSAQWPFADQLDTALGDVDAFIGRFTDRADDETVFDLMLSSGEGACRVCHDHLRM